MADMKRQRLNLPLLATTENCSGRTFIVTGANVGLGYEASKHLVSLGAATVIMAVRNVSAGEAAKAEIEAATGTTNIAKVWALDLSSYDSVKAFSKKAIDELDRIDALIENAAVAMSPPTKAEGHLLAITVNVMSTFLLAVLLLPKMTETAQRLAVLPHIVIVTSLVSLSFKDGWDKIKDDPIVKIDQAEQVMQTYPLSKLLEILAVYHLAPLIPVSRTGVVMNLVHPGLCKTTLSRDAPPAFRESLAKDHEEYGRTAEDGSRTLLHGAVAGKESHGMLLHSCEIHENVAPSWVTDKEGREKQKAVWDSIARELESIVPGCVEKVM